MTTKKNLNECVGCGDEFADWDLQIGERRPARMPRYPLAELKKLHRS